MDTLWSISFCRNSFSAWIIPYMQKPQIHQHLCHIRYVLHPKSKLAYLDGILYIPNIPINSISKCATLYILNYCLKRLAAHLSESKL